MEIKLLLEKYKNLGFSQKRVKEIMLITFEKFNLKVDSDDIKINQTEIKINISGTKRTHFTLIKKQFEEELQTVLKGEGLLITKIY